LYNAGPQRHRNSCCSNLLCRHARGSGEEGCWLDATTDRVPLSRGCELVGDAGNGLDESSYREPVMVNGSTAGAVHARAPVQPPKGHTSANALCQGLRTRWPSARHRRPALCAASHAGPLCARPPVRACAPTGHRAGCGECQAVANRRSMRNLTTRHHHSHFSVRSGPSPAPKPSRRHMRMGGIDNLAKASTEFALVVGMADRQGDLVADDFLEEVARHAASPCAWRRAVGSVRMNTRMLSFPHPPPTTTVYNPRVWPYPGPGGLSGPRIALLLPRRPANESGREALGNDDGGNGSDAESVGGGIRRRTDSSRPSHRSSPGCVAVLTMLRAHCLSCDTALSHRCCVRFLARPNPHCPRFGSLWDR